MQAKHILDILFTKSTVVVPWYRDDNTKYKYWIFMYHGTDKELQHIIDIGLLCAKNHGISMIIFFKELSLLKKQ